MQLEQPRIDVDLEPSGGHYAAIVSLVGEHDISTSRDLEAALAPILGLVLVDLTECSFMDSATLGVILRKARMLRADEHDLELRSRVGSTVARMLTIASVADVVNVHDAGPAGN